MQLQPRPNIINQFHQNFMRGAQHSSADNTTFMVSNASDSILRQALLESGWMMSAITQLDVAPQKGQAIDLGNNSLHTGRALEGRFYKKLELNGTAFFLAETDSCASLPYIEMASLANLGSLDYFNDTVAEFFSRAIALDMLRIGFNGTHIAPVTDPTTYKRGQDINIGWHQVAKEYQSGVQVVSESLILGAGGDFPHLDSLANHLITTKIPEEYREDPSLVVLVGAELAAADRLKLFNTSDRPADLAAAQMLSSSVAGRFAFIPPFMPGKRLAVTTLKNLHIYTQECSRRFRAECVDQRGVYEHNYIRNEGYALGDPRLYTAVDESAITIKG